jgi:uncharacterized protein YjiS (DUF1127 family)
MRTTERLLSTSVQRSPAFKARVTSVLAAMLSVCRVFRNRLQINQLHELDDNQLRDIGLTRGDLETALASSAFFEDPSSHLTLTARRRARAAFVGPYRD